MGKPAKYVIGTVILVAAGIAAFHWWHRSAPTPAAAPAAAGELKPVTALPEKRTFALELPWVGNVQSRSRVEVEALTEGRVETVAAQDEAPVAAGVVLFTIGGTRLAAQKRQLQDQADALGKRVELARQVLEGKRSSEELKLATRSDVAAAEDALDKLTADLAAAQQQLKVLEGAATVTAPAGGVFTGRRVSVGQAVSAGQVLSDIVDPDHLRVEARVFAPAGVALEGLKATVRLSQSQVLNGTVARVLPTADQTGAAVVWVEGDEVDRGLRPGQTVSGTLTAQSHEAWGVPQSAVVYGEDEAPYVFVARGSAFEKVAIQVGVVSDGWVEALSGLDGMLPVVTEGAYELLYREFQKSYRVAD